jgi:hypothetical protein
MPNSAIRGWVVGLGSLALTMVVALVGAAVWVVQSPAIQSERIARLESRVTVIERDVQEHRTMPAHNGTGERLAGIETELRLVRRQMEEVRGFLFRQYGERHRAQLPGNSEPNQQH